MDILTARDTILLSDITNADMENVSRRLYLMLASAALIVMAKLEEAAALIATMLHFIHHTAQLEKVFTNNWMKV